MTRIIKLPSEVVNGIINCIHEYWVGGDEEYSFDIFDGDAEIKISHTGSDNLRIHIHTYGMGNSSYTPVDMRDENVRLFSLSSDLESIFADSFDHSRIRFKRVEDVETELDERVYGCDFDMRDTYSDSFSEYR